MNMRENNLLWLKDLLDHLVETRDHLEWAETGVSMRMVLDSMLRDLDNCRRLCENLRRKTALVEAA